MTSACPSNRKHIVVPGRPTAEAYRPHGRKIDIPKPPAPRSRPDLAERGVIGIYPVGGWWKDQPKRDRSDKGARYVLVVSIETPGVATDIWTPVAQQVGVPIVIET